MRIDVRIEDMDKHEKLISLTDKEKEILLLVVQYRAITRKALKTLADLPSGTLYRMVESMITKGMLETEKDSGATKVGRPNDIIKINPRYGYFCSISVRRFAFHVAILDFARNIICDEHFSCDESTLPAQIRETCYDSFRKMAGILNIEEEDIICVTITSFNTPKETFVKENIHPGFFWRDIKDIASFFSETFRFHIFFGNAALANACSYYYSSFFPESRNLAYIILDEGIGAGYIVDRKIPRYSMRNVNGLGHMIVDIHGPQCYCGQYGCLETIVNDFAILERYRNEFKIRNTGMLGNSLSQLDILSICKASDQGDPIACSSIEYAASVLAIGVKNLMKLLTLEIIVVSGKMAANSSFFKTSLENRLKHEHPELIVEVDNKEWEHSIIGIAEWYMNEALSLTPLKGIIK